MGSRPRSEWVGMLRFAALRLGIGPEAFWRLSLREWRALTEDGGPAALGRYELEALLRAYPDRGASAPRPSPG